jgi:hypothetical protein
MWNLTPDYLANVKKELKGRRAAIQARIADELKAIDADIEEIETLERVAYSFAVKHLPEQEAVAEPVSEPMPQPQPDQELEGVANLQGEPASSPRRNSTAEPKGGLSRWRVRLDSNAESD